MGNFMSNTDLNTALDFLDYALIQAEQANLWYGHGTDNPEDDFLILILRSLNLPLDCDEQDLRQPLTEGQRRLLMSQLEKRIVHKIPVPYLIHEAYFAGDVFYVDQRVLIPRSPLAECIEQRFEPWVTPDSVSHILELCTGSACIAIACAHAFPNAQVVATDISEDALAVAEINVQQHGLEGRVQLIQSDLWAQVPQQRYDLIIANPPYVSHEEMQTLPAEYRYEPTLALEAKDNGLAIVNNILMRAAQYLTDEGILVVEVGNTADPMIEAYPDLPLIWFEFERGGEGVFMLDRQSIVVWLNRRSS